MSQPFPSGTSVIVPVSRATSKVLESLLTVCEAVDRLEGEKELIFSLDRSGQPGQLRTLLSRYPFARIITHSGPQSMRTTRMRAIEAARFDVLLFTDDDCWLEPDWASRLLASVRAHGVVTGLVAPVRLDTLYAKLEALIDVYRAEAMTRTGTPKFVSFPNLGLQRALLPRVPFDERAAIYGNDMDLGCRLRLSGAPIHVERELIVRTEYPRTLAHVLRRKLAHAQGISYVQRRLGPARWARLEIGSHGEILRRWIRLSLTARLPLREKTVFLLMNLTYALGLIYHFNVTWRKMPEIEARDLTVPE